MILPTDSNQSSKLSISEILPLGYLYLLVLGIIAESIYYGLIGINFLSYASILDVLLGPVAILTDQPVLLGLLVLIGVILYYLLFVRKKKDPKDDTEKNSADPAMGYVLLMGFMILAAFIGYGLGKGVKAKNKIANNDIEHNTIIHFLDGEKKEVRKLGNTGSFLFYVQKDQKNLSIVPIATSIKEIEQKK